MDTSTEINVSLAIEYTAEANLSVDGVTDSTLTLDDVYIGGEPPHYAGSYEFTPSSESQTIVAHGMMLDGDIVIDPIPSNYGLITWDGSTITVS